MSAKKPGIVWTPEQCERLAKFAHLGQTDKVGEDYFNGHIYEAVQILKYGTGTPKSLDAGPSLYRRLASDEDRDMAEMILWLHDSDEDTDLTVKVLVMLGAPYPLWSGVYKMGRPSQRPEWKDLTEASRTKANIRYHEDIRENPILLAAKEADLASNTHPRRVYALNKIDPAAVERLAKKYAADRAALGLEDPWKA